MGDVTTSAPVKVPPPSSEGGARRTLITIAGVIVAIVVGIAGCAVVAETALSHALGDLGLDPFAHVKPIPISQDACPYLRLVRETAARSGATLLADPNSSRKRNYDEFRMTLRSDLDGYATALRAAQSQVPDPIAQQLLLNLSEVLSGEDALSQAHSATEYFHKNVQSAARGYHDLGYASALVGDACGFHVVPPAVFGATPVLNN